MHLHYLGSEQRNGSLRGQHLDYRGLGGYVLRPPSQIGSPDHIRRYELTAYRGQPGRTLDWTAVTHLLAPRKPQMTQPALTTLGKDPTLWLAAHVARQREGNRDNALFWAACRAAEAGAHDLTPLITAAISTGLPERQATRTARSAQDTITRGAVPAPRPHPSTLPLHQTEPPVRSTS